MKKLAIVFSLLAVCGFMLGACGDDGDNDCVKAGKVMMAGMDEACSGKDSECCFCKCWNDGHKGYDITAYGADGTCTCTEPVDGDTTECTGADLEAAQACLEDETACKATGAGLVTDSTTGLCTTTPLQ